MKKKFLTFILSICFIIPCMFMLSACTTTPPDIEFKVENGYIQYYDGKTWSDLIAIEDLKGEDGDDGIGINGREVEFRKTSTHIQWRYVVANQSSEIGWTNLILLEELEGKDATYTTYTVTYDYGKADSFFKTTKTSDSVKSTEWLTTLPEIKDDYKNSFLGWYIQGTNKLVSNYDFIGGNVTLEARFNIDLLGLSGLYQQGKYVMTWEEVAETCAEGISNGEIISKDCETYHESYFAKLNGELVLDESITALGEYAFIQTNITYISIPETIKSISKGAFYNSKLESIHLSDNITTIDDYAFQYCRYLKSITLPTNLVSIGEHAFYGCYTLTEIAIPYKVANIGYQILSECNNLKNIDVDEANTIFDSRNNCNAIIKTASNELIMGCSATVIPNSVTTIGVNAFVQVNLTNIVIPEGVQVIKQSAFTSCTNLTTIIISDKIEKIESNAFAFCNSLDKIFYSGDSDSWNNVEDLENLDSLIYYYSETEPTEEGNYWHFDTDNVTPIVW